MDISIVIAHRGDPMGLWATIHSCENELLGSGLRYEFRIVHNGEKKTSFDLNRLVKFCEKAGHLGLFEHRDEPLSPPAARQIGTRGASGKYLFFFDNHCLVARDYFKRSLVDFEHYGMDMLHSATKFYEGEYTHYHYKLKLAHNFWGESQFLIANQYKPYRIAAGGHGGFAVRNSVWNEVGGYGPEGLFEGYGGEEMYFDLKMALLGKTNWLDPRVIHYHYAGHRGYARHYTDDYYRNMMMVAKIIGGDDWMYRVYRSFKKHPKCNTGRTMYQLMMDAEDRGRTHAREMARIRQRTLNEQLDKFVVEQIAVD